MVEEKEKACSQKIIDQHDALHENYEQQLKNQEELYLKRL
jgi:hypothetical protein